MLFPCFRTMLNASYYTGEFYFTGIVSGVIFYHTTIVTSSKPRMLQPHNNITIEYTSDRLTPIYGKHRWVRVTPPVREVDGLATRAEHRKGLSDTIK